MPEGRTSTYLVGQTGRATVKQTFRFLGCDEKGVDVEVTHATKPLPTKEPDGSWWICSRMGT